MQFQYSHRRDEKEAIFFSVENGAAEVTPGTPPILKGQLCAWDITDNTAVSGITANTRGTRVILYPTAEAGDVADGLCRKAGFAHTDMAGTPANTRGSQSYLIQVYGWRNDITANTDAGTNILAGGIIVPAGDAAGAVDGPTTEGTPLVNEIVKTVGISMQAVAVNTTVVIEAIVNCLR